MKKTYHGQIEFPIIPGESIESHNARVNRIIEPLIFSALANEPATPATHEPAPQPRELFFPETETISLNGFLIYDNLKSQFPAVTYHEFNPRSITILIPNPGRIILAQIKRHIKSDNQLSFLFPDLTVSAVHEFDTTNAVILTY